MEGHLAPPPLPPPSRAASPPRPSRKEKKISPPSPPMLIKDSGRQLEFQRLGFLGEGGFARVYEAQDEGGRRLALKCVSKKTLLTTKTKTKLYAEIKLHKMLDHPNIVRFKECFDDDENVYMGLELCEKGSMMDVLRRRKSMTEPEVRYWLVQLIGACSYMHGENVIHRDLKLGNIFLDSRLEVKVGDFGLAALIEKEGDRKKTICGTPNYIAPEVLFDTANGHSFEVDVWSIGVILYTLIIGKPPFQTKEIKAIYKRIKDNQYEFPPEKEISPEARDLITEILTVDPRKRPTLQTILQHPFFLAGPFPSSLPSSAAESAPDFRHLSSQQSVANFQRARSKASQSRPIATTRVRASLGPSVAQQEREFHRAVQPDSPLSALLSSARQPLLVSHEPNLHRGSPLHRKLAASSLTSESKRDRPLPSSRPTSALMPAVGEDSEDEDPLLLERQEKELAEQKARIVAESIQESSPRPHPPQREREREREREPSAPSHRPITSNGRENSARVPLPLPSRPSSKQIVVVASSEQEPPAPAPSSRASSRPISEARIPSRSPRVGSSKAGGSFDVVSRNVQLAVDSLDGGLPFLTPHISSYPPPPEVFIVSWLDYCNKYGMGYTLSDGSVGVHFNDSTSLILAPDKEHFDWLTTGKSKSSTTLNRRNYTISSFPDDLKSKIYLLKHFQGFMEDRLLKDKPWCFVDSGRTKGLEFVQRYLRMKHVIVFKMSHDVLQFNFYDHVKIILSSDGLVVTYISDRNVMDSWSLAYLFSEEAAESHEGRTIELVVRKIQYLNILLKSIHSGPSAVPTSSSKSKSSSSRAVAREREEARPLR
ncbi:kinase-like domain-containing protein [Mrakia frigida]|uniref:polo kinase CDC5 n=1 Tax=Mrakia frigida TaxID=29902 RepID=UPI003FCC0FC0